MPSDSKTSINYNFQIPDHENPSRYLRAFLVLLQSTENWDTDATLACYDETVKYQILPASLGYPARSMEEYTHFWKDVAVIFGGNKFVVSLFPSFMLWRGLCYEARFEGMHTYLSVS